METEANYKFCEESVAAKEFKRGLFQKCHGLSLLTGCSVFLRIVDKGDGIQFFGSRDQIKQYMNNELVYRETDREISGDSGLPKQHHQKSDLMETKVYSGNGSDSKRHLRKALSKITSHNTDSDSGHSSSSNIITLSDDDDGGAHDDDDDGDGGSDGDNEKEMQSDQSDSRDSGNTSTSDDVNIIKSRRPQILDVMTEIIKRQDDMKSKWHRTNSLATFGQKVADKMIETALRGSSADQEEEKSTNKNDSHSREGFLRHDSESNEDTDHRITSNGSAENNYGYNEGHNDGNNMASTWRERDENIKREHQNSQMYVGSNDTQLGDVTAGSGQKSSNGSRQHEPLDFSQKRNGDFVPRSKVFVRDDGTPVLIQTDSYGHSEERMLYSNAEANHSLPPFDYYKLPLKNIKRKYHCGTCAKAFTQLSVLKEHLKTHTGEKPYVCKACGKEFSHPSNFKRHERLVHSNANDKRRHQCPICFKAFPLSHHLKEHFRIHSGERPYHCKICGQRFKQSSTLKTHQKRHSLSQVFNVEQNVYPTKLTMSEHASVLTSESTSPTQREYNGVVSNKYNNFDNVGAPMDRHDSHRQVMPGMMYAGVPTGMKHGMQIHGSLLSDSHPATYQRGIQNLAYREHLHMSTSESEMSSSEHMSPNERGSPNEPNKRPPPLIHLPSKDSQKSKRTEFMSQQTERDMLMDREGQFGSPSLPDSTKSTNPARILTPKPSQGTIQSVLNEPVESSYTRDLLPHQPWYRYKLKGNYEKPLKRIENINSNEMKADGSQQPNMEVPVVDMETEPESGASHNMRSSEISDKKTSVDNDGECEKANSPNSNAPNSDQYRNLAKEKLLPMLLKTDVPKKLTCQICDKTVTTLAAMNDHVKNFHWSVEKYVCPDCGRAFSNQSNFKRHQRLMHEEVKVRQHQCPVCLKAFPLGHHLKEHFRIHSGERPYKCDICGKGFTQSSTLKNHKKTHSPVHTPVQSSPQLVNGMANVHVADPLPSGSQSSKPQSDE